MADIPGNTVLALCDRLLDRVHKLQPLRSDGTAVDDGIACAVLTLGIPIDPADYLAPRVPPRIVPQAGAAGGTATTPPDADAMRALNAAYNTATLADQLLQITADGSYAAYPGGRHLSFQYQTILAGIQALPEAPLPPAVAAQIDAAMQLLYVADPDDPTSTVRSPAYESYRAAASAYAKAKADYALAFAASRLDRAQAEAWPVASARYQKAIHAAWDVLNADGAQQVERALDTVVSAPMRDDTIQRARKAFDRYTVDFAGVAAAMPWSQIQPGTWCDPASDDGWTTFTIASSQATSYDATHFARSTQGAWKVPSGAANAAGVSVGFAGFQAIGGATVAAPSVVSGWEYTHTFSATASDLTVSLEFMLCDFVRPWLAGDMFSLRDYYVVGVDKNGISDGTAYGQAGDTSRLLPAITQQMLVIRNVRVSSSTWGADGEVLQSYYGTQTSSGPASGGACLGFISLGGAKGGTTSSAGSTSSFGSARGDSYFGTSFDGQTLTIAGPQIVAFVNAIVPASPPCADPQLASPAKTPTTAGASS